MARSATAVELDQLTENIRTNARAQGLQDSIIDKLERNGPVITVLDDSGNALFVAGSLGAIVRHESDRGFVPARVISALAFVGLGERAPVEDLQLYSDARGEGRRSYQLIDVLDVDGDGVAEVVIASNGYEGWGYQLYEYGMNGWQMTYRNTVGGC